MESTSSPSSPTRTAPSPLELSSTPSGSMTEDVQIRRRTSSFSDRSPTTPKSKHRFSNASQLSYDPAGGAEGGGVGGGTTGLGNLADELDQLDDDYEEEYEDDSALFDQQAQGPEVRDSGIDVSYSHANGGLYSRKFGSPSQRPPDEEGEDRFSPELDELMTAIAHMSSSINHEDADPLIPRAIARLQDLGNQTGLEAGAQRLTTSTNSLAAHLSSQSKTLQNLAQHSLFSPIPAFPTDDTADPTLQLLETLHSSLPQPDTAALQKIRILDRETADVMATLAALTDTLQLGRQMANSASRHLRSTLTMVGDLRREQERAETARDELRRESERAWEEKVRSGWCKAQCGDIVSGFEERCESLRRRIEAGA